MKAIRRRFWIPFVALLGLSVAAGIAATGQRPHGITGTWWPMTTPAAGPRSVDAPTPVDGIRPGISRTEPAEVAARRMVVAVNQALLAEAPDAVWSPSPGHPAYLVKAGRDGRPISVRIGSPLVRDERRGDLQVTITLGASGAAEPEARRFDWSCRSADRRQGALCDESSAPDGTRTRIQTSVGRDGSVRHRVDVELPAAGRLQLDVSNISGQAEDPPASDAPLLMEEARAVALNIAARIGP
ncbi:hypothetical protein NCC78_08005 [Micromonospora phytophila]|uniref:hypothetical protein n=1 Tax=Micromonospora phytophila TaxID=709888 RepID=UPI00202EE0A7|nr:hypothetical protein [Micromonospora phytophila]MCM0674629.1 hypothetical protein [Micromonospora phytophila]